MRKTLNLVAGAVGHEVANPLMAIIAWLEHRRERSEAPGGNDFDQILDQCWRIADTLRTLRALPYPALERERSIHIGQLVRAVIAGPRGDRLRVEAKIDEDALVRGDPLVLLYVCTTLLHHALDSFPREAADDGNPEPHVRVVLRIEGRTAVLEVWDRGPPIPPDELGQLYSAEYHGRTRGWSIGLRLLYVREAIEAFGGTLEIANDTAGGGVVCRMVLPIAPPRSAPSPSSQSQSRPPASIK